MKPWIRKRPPQSARHQGGKCRVNYRRWNKDWVNVSVVCTGEYVGLEEMDDGIWNVYFGPLKLGRFHERLMRIEDEYGRIKRK